MLPLRLKQISALVLSALILFTILRKVYNKFRGIPDTGCDLPEPRNKRDKDEYILHIEGMSCQHCVMNVKKGLSSLDGVEELVVNLQTNSARVKGRIDQKSLEKTIADLGYKLKGIE